MHYFEKFTNAFHIMPTLLISLMLFLATNSFANVEAPTFNYEPGKYHTPISVTIKCVTPDVKIYYTTDGTTPDENSDLYQAYPILVWKHASGDSVTFTGDNDPDSTDDNKPLSYRSKTIKAIAINGNQEKSEIASADYVIDLVETTFYIPYDNPPSVGGDKHTLDVYHPIGKSKNPVIFFVYGGAWKQGDKTLYMELGNTMAGYYGITTVIINYELSTDPWNAVHPEHIKNVAKAFKWTYDNIENYGGDRENIYLFGQSAGAHLVSLLATDTNYLNANGLSADNIKAVISMSGVYDIYDQVEWPNNPLGLDATEVLEFKTLCLNAFGGWDQGLLDSASPKKFIKANQPPFRLIALNETNTFVDMPGFGQQARNFYANILALNGPFVELKLLNQEDIPPEIYAIDFPGNTDGHYDEIYSINTLNWNSVSSKMVAEFIQDIPSIPQMQNPSHGATDISINPNLNWFRCSEALYYYLQVATESTFGSESIVFDSPVADTTWTLTSLFPDTKYYWRIKAINSLGESEWSAVREFQTTSNTGVEPKNIIHPENFSLNLYPNPFNGIVKIKIDANNIKIKDKSQIEIYDILGKKIYQEKINLTAGQNIFTWQPHNNPSGLYFINVNYGGIGKRLMNKVMYIK